MYIADERADDNCPDWKEKGKLFSCWEMLHDFLSSVDFLTKSKYFRNIIRVSNSLDPDQENFGLGLGPNCLQT